MKDNKIHQTWGVVGGGILGMTIAYYLRKEGFKVTLFESAKEVGGLTSSWKLGTIIWDKFYHVILLSDKHLRELLRELHLENEISWVETKTGFYADGKLYSMSNLFEFISFPPLDLLGKLRLGFTIFFASKIKNWRKLERISVEEWLTKLSGKKTFEKIWLPLLRAKLGDNYKNTSAAFIWATIQRMYAARKDGLKKEMFGYVKGGYNRILKRYQELLENMGIEIRTAYQAKNIFRSEDKTMVEFENKEIEPFDNVILTIPATAAEKLCSGLSEYEKEKLNEIKYLGVVCVSLLLEKPVSNYYVTNIIDSFTPFTGIIEMSALVNKAEFGCKNLIYIPKYVTSDDEIFKKNDSEILDEFIVSFLRMYPQIKKEDIICGKAAKAKYVFALPNLNYSEKLPAIKTSIPGVYILNSAHIINGTLNVNETIGLVKGKFMKEIFNKAV